MSVVNQIVQTFAGLGYDDREATMKVLSGMMRDGSQHQPKKKVNGFMGYRAYYSVLFSQLPQKERSPFMTMLWQRDPFHNEWDFMCDVYSTIRAFLAEENIPLQVWILHAVDHLGIVARHTYLDTFGWRLVQLQDETHSLQRTTTSEVRHRLQPINGLDLFLACLANGLPVSNPQPIITKLSDPRNDILCMNHGSLISSNPSRLMNLDSLGRRNTDPAMKPHFEGLTTEPVIPQRATVYENHNSHRDIVQSTQTDVQMSSVDSFSMDDSSSGAMVHTILEGDDNTEVETETGPDFFNMAMVPGAGAHLEEFSDDAS
ncbi:mating-type protein MAT alpha 1-domain-containing protein [Podospora didyma]|uniref:Mating-type protein MAT alpha 1-domain-containing protein n=1 Tax=Podospora didyma TaxID=330526 RepID=A0AAE0K8L4_9PEZI|nr:mating-type protein MAT alpha 1-domain-containing protein [Podospora didyma]